MGQTTGSQGAQDAAEERVDQFRRGLGPFVVAAERTHMPMIFTDAEIKRHPIVFANDSFLALTGFDREALLGKPIAHVLKEVTDPNTRSAIETALDTGVDGTWEAQCRRANGSEYLATVFLTPVPDDVGVARQHFLSFVDMSGRIDRLLKQRDEFNALYEKAPGFVVALEGSEHRFTFVNASYKRLVGREDLIGRRIADAVPEIADQGLLALLDRVFQTGEPFVANSMPVRIAAEDGRSSKLHYLNVVYQPVRDGGDTITGLFVEGFDVTAEHLGAEQLSLLRDELVHASRVNAMGMMAATLAHELNQPLAAISNYAGASVRLVDPDSRDAIALAEALGGIEEAAQRAGDIIRNVRELTRRGETPKALFDLKPAITECVRLVRAGGCPAGTIEDRTREELIVLADRIQIQQVMINLLRNACDAIAGAADGRVAIEAAVRSGHAIVSVTDTGPGLSREAAENIFLWTETSKEGGTGLGLSISRTIVEANGGRIWLENSSNMGSQFCFSVPLGAGGPGERDGR
jgi:two-component system sensor kinase FixL